MERPGLSSSWIMICIIKGGDVTLDRTSFVAMVLAINVVAYFTTLLVVASAVLSPFPHGRSLSYKYRLDAKAGAIEPAAYASQFTLEGILRVKHDTSHSELKNAYYVVLSDVKIGMHNGIAAYNHRTKADKPIDEAAASIEQPFLIVYDDNGRLEGVKIPEEEAGWSKNMKMAMASMLQLDLSNMNVETPVEAQSFISNEKTIHGDCLIIYDVHAKNDSTTNEFVVTKFLSPMNCTRFAVQSFNHVDIEGCQIDKGEPMTVDSRRIFEIERKNDDIIIKKLVALGGVNYLPWNSEAQFHYILTNATFELDPDVSERVVDLPVVDFGNASMVRDITYQRPRGTYADDAAEDITQGRHVVHPRINSLRLLNVLEEAADYIEEHHLHMNSPEWKHGQTLNRILHIMSYLDIESLQHIFNMYQSTDSARNITIRNLLIGILPQVGTAATSLFTLNIIRNKKVSDITAIEILAKLPLTVKVPTEKLLVRMEELIKFDESVPVEVRRASVLCFSSLVYRTFKDASRPEESTVLNGYLQAFYDRLKNHPNYEMKMLYLMAIKNVRVGKIYELLAPIIRGELRISENPEEIRFLAIWAINRAVENDYTVSNDLLWPVMADTSLPVKLRIASYEILMHQARNQADVFQMRRFMSFETNEHLYHYHFTTVNNIIRSVDPCKRHLRELVTKIMRNGKPHDSIKRILSSAFSFDYKIEKYNYLEKLHAAVVVNEVTGLPEVAQLDNTITDGREAISDITIRLHVQGCDDITNLLLRGVYFRPRGVTNRRVIEILKKAAKEYPKDVKVDVILMHMGRVILANHYNQQSLKNLYDDVKRFFERHTYDYHVNSQHVIHIHLAEKKLVSDVGFPVLMESRLPVAASMRFRYNRVPEFEPTSVDLGVDLKFWSHGDYALSIYNPLADAWHAIRRPTAIDASLPIRAILNWNPSTKHLKMSFQRLSATKPRVGGIRMYVKDIVTLDGDDDEALKKSCPTCDLRKDVSRGKLDIIHRNIDSASTGLEYSIDIFDCENGASPVTLSSEWYRAVMYERNNTWIDWYVNDKVTMRQELNNMLPGSMGSVGILGKVEPSRVYPTSRVDLSLQVSFTDAEDTGASFSSLGSKKFIVHGTIDAISASTNTSARSWGLDIDIDVNQDHTFNMAMVQVVRKTLDEKNLKICLGAQKRYSDIPTDLLRVNGSKEIVTSNVTIAAAYGDGEECAYNGTLVTITMKAELSDEQKKKLSQDMSSGACSEDMKNSVYANPENTVPKTLNCLNEAIRYTTLRKYTVNVAHRNVPEIIEDMIFTVVYVIREHKLPNVKYTRDRVDAKKIKVKTKLPMRKNVVDLSVILPMGSYDATDIPIGIPILRGLGPTVKSPWYWPLENSRFGLLDLIEYSWDALRFCSIYREAVVAGDGNIVAFNISERWTLILGDHVDRQFAVFAKMDGENLSTKIYMENYEVEIAPDSRGNFRATVDGRPFGRLESRLIVPADSNNWTVKLTKEKSHVFVQMKDVPLTIIHSVNHLVLAIDIKLQGKISGVCDYLNRSHPAKVAESHMTPEF